MELQELLLMNIEVLNLIDSPQVRLPQVLSELVKKLITENNKKLEEIEE